MTAEFDDPCPDDGVPSLLAAWALDACSDEEAEAVMDHISRCQSCATEAARLRGIADLLSGVDLPSISPDHPRTNSHRPLTEEGRVHAESDRTSAEPGLRRPDGLRIELGLPPERARVSGAGPEMSPVSVGRPPEGLRGRILSGARVRRAPAPVVPTYAAPYAAQVSVLEALLAELGEGDWHQLVVNDWNVQELVAHLTATDGLLAAQVGVPVEPPLEGTGRDVAARTAALLAHNRGRSPELTREAWRRQATGLCAALTEQQADRVVEVAWPLPIKDIAVARAFETWIHTDDIANALGRRLPAPLPEHVHAMVTLGIAALPLAMAVRGAARPAQSAHLRLHGPGGGDYRVPLAPGDTPATLIAPTEPQDGDPTGADHEPGPHWLSDAEVTIALDVLEFCFLMADRRDPETIAVEINGDEAAARALLSSAAAFAGP